MIILNSIAWLKHLDILQTINRAKRLFLNIGRDRTTNSVGIDDVGIEALRLEPDSMGLFLGKFNNLRFERRAISGSTNGFANMDGLVEILPNDLMSLRVGVREVTVKLVLFRSERANWRACLDFNFTVHETEG
jgi:hypothetical protein